MKIKSVFTNTLLCAAILVFFGIGARADNTEKPNEGNANEGIVTVDISYELFVALATYQETWNRR